MGSIQWALSVLKATAVLGGVAVLATGPSFGAEVRSVSHNTSTHQSTSVETLAQFGLPRIPRPPINLPGSGSGLPIPGLGNLLDEDPPLTTSLADVVWEMPILDRFEPTEFSLMTALQWDPQRGYLAAPGYYELIAESYCLMAGTHGPGGGDGYAYAELEGPQGDIIRKILREAVNHPEIPQRQIQVLLWGITSRTKLSDMSAESQAVARQMLNDGERRRLDGGALGQIPPEVRRQLFANLPRQVRQVLEAEAELRRQLTRANATYQQLEAIAVLTGAVEQGEGSRTIPQGRWSLHPDGYYVRYRPSGYSRTQMQVMVPEEALVERDGLGRIVAIATHDGYRVETDYNDGVGAIPVPGEPNLRAYQFSMIRLISPGRPLIEVPNQGWTFVGTATGNAQLSQLPTHWFSNTSSLVASAQPSHGLLAQADRIQQLNDAYERYQKAKEAKQQVDDILEEIDRLQNPPTQEQAEEILDMDHYQEGLDAALGNDPSARVEWIAEHQKRQQRSWAYAICKLRSIGSGRSCGDSEDEDPQDPRDPRTPNQPQDPNRPRIPRRPRNTSVNPGGQGAIPGNTNRQRLGISSRPVR